MSSYFMRRDGVLHGPYTIQQLVAASKSGKLNASDEIGRSEDGPWYQAAKVPQLEPFFPKPIAAPPLPIDSPSKSEEEAADTAPAFRTYQTTPAKPNAKDPVREGMEFSDLFDWKFTHFITPALNQLLYMLITGMLIFAALFQLVVLELNFWSQYEKNEFIDWVVVIGGGFFVIPVAIFLAWAIVQIVVRNAFEIALVLFRIEENTRRSR
ncbi:MAG: DUF4282 domain-containing protein [Planctomycetota bacterium]|jgi:hypothetical protein